MAPSQLCYYVVGACILASAVLFIMLVVLSLKGPPKVPLNEGAFPARRKRTFARVLTTLFVTGTLLAVAIVAYPRILDPWWPEARDAITNLVGTL